MGILYCVGFWIMVTIRSSSSEVSSPALHVSSAFVSPASHRNPPLIQINIGLFANQVRISSPDTLDFCQGVHNLLLAIDVGVEDSKDELDCRKISYLCKIKLSNKTYSSTSPRSRELVNDMLAIPFSG